MAIVVAMPEPVNPRPYHSPLRARQAAATRRRIVGAATRLFLRDGYPGTSLAAVAREAGVAADTVLHVFGSKRGLLRAVMDVTIGGDDRDLPLLERPGPQAMRLVTDQHRQLRMFAAGVTTRLERLRPMDDILRSAATVDREAAALLADLHLRQRREAMTAVAGWVAAHGPLRVDERSAADTLWSLASPAAHRAFRVDLGRSAEEFRDWLADVLVRVLLP